METGRLFFFHHFFEAVGRLVGGLDWSLTCISFFSLILFLGLFPLKTESLEIGREWLRASFLTCLGIFYDCIISNTPFSGNPLMYIYVYICTHVCK